jgi:hypothetical protein
MSTCCLKSLEDWIVDTSSTNFVIVRSTKSMMAKLVLGLGEEGEQRLALWVAGTLRAGARS